MIDISGAVCYLGEGISNINTEVYMRYHYNVDKGKISVFGEIYYCDHPVYNECTLFEINGKGLAVIQQRYNEHSKMTWWGSIDPYLTDAIYLHPWFKEYFDDYAGTCTDGLYPTVTIRQIMWALKMKPLSKEPWETYFDRRDI